MKKWKESAKLDEAKDKKEAAERKAEATKE